VFQFCVGERKAILLEGTNWFRCASDFTEKMCAKDSPGDCSWVFFLTFHHDWIIIENCHQVFLQRRRVLSPPCHRSPLLSG
jgi:hypothetical protein